MMAKRHPTTPLHGREQINGVTDRIAVPTGWVYRFPRSDTFVPDPDADHVLELARQRSEERRERAPSPEIDPMDLSKWPVLNGMTPWGIGPVSGRVALFRGYFAFVGADGWRVWADKQIAKGDEPWIDGARMAVGWLAKRTGAKLVDATD